MDPQLVAPTPSCQAAQAALPASHTLATVARLTAERLPCLEWRPLKCPNHLRSSVASSEKPSLRAQTPQNPQISKPKALVRMWRNQNTHALLVGI